MLPGLFGLKPMSEKAAKRSIRPRTSRREIAERINAAFEAGDIDEICHVIGAAAHQHNISELARRSGIERTSLYRAFAGREKHPNFTTVLNVLHAMGFALQVTMRPNAQAPKPQDKEPHTSGAFDLDREVENR